jgi:hypothetical protein
MEDWQKILRYDALDYLMASKSEAIKFFTMRDLQGETSIDVRSLWTLPEVVKITLKQMEDGSWAYPNKKVYAERPFENYSCLETYRNLGLLVDMYGMNYEHHSICEAIGYLFGLQTNEGDFRGIYGTQYSPNYSAGIMELMIKAGYWRHPGIKKGIEWLLSVRQNDGGWALPLRTRGLGIDRKTFESPPLAPDRSKPYSHLITGVVLRAFAAHPDHRNSVDALKAGALLKCCFFLPDAYTDRGKPSYWTSVSFPFWFTDIVSSLDSLSLMGFPAYDPHVKRALEWLIQNQRPDGSWELKILRNNRQYDLGRWISLAICRIFKRFYL